MQTNPSPCPNYPSKRRPSHAVVVVALPKQWIVASIADPPTPVSKRGLIEALMYDRTRFEGQLETCTLRSPTEVHIFSCAELRLETTYPVDYLSPRPEIASESVGPWAKLGYEALFALLVAPKKGSGLVECGVFERTGDERGVSQRACHCREPSIFDNVISIAMEEH